MLVKDCVKQDLIDGISSLFGEEILLIEDEYGNRELQTKSGLFTLVIFGVGQRYLASIHLSEYFNKQSDCPLQFIVDKQQRHPITIKQRNRIRAAISFLKEHQEEEYYYCLPGFEDLDSSHYQSFLLEWKAKPNEKSWCL